MHLTGFVIRIYCDAQSSECQIRLVAVCPSLLRVNIKHPLSQYSCTYTRYHGFHVTISALSTRIFLFNRHFLHKIPTLFVFLITHLSKSCTNTTLGMRFCLFFPGDFRSYSGLLAFLSLCFLQTHQLVHQDIHVYITTLQQQFLPCFLLTCLNSICYNFLALRMNSFMLRGSQCILHSTQTQIKYKHTKIYTNTLNIHKSNMYIHIYIYTGCPRRNVPDFGREFLILKYTDITQNTYIQS